MADADHDDDPLESAQRWEEAAPGWERRNADLRAFAAPVTQWLLDAAELAPGQRVLELAAGVGETGLLAAELVAPGGAVILSDRSDSMLAAARRRAELLGVANVEFKQMDAQWIDLPVGDVDAIICRWGLMLLDDPPAALSEMRRVLRAGGRIALAMWDSPSVNPWLTLATRLAVEQGLAERPPEEAPGPFALADRERVRDLLDGAGFTDVEIDAVDLAQPFENAGDYWEQTLDLSRMFHDAVMGATEAQADALRDALAERMAQYATDGGGLLVPARTLVARASA